MMYFITHLIQAAGKHIQSLYADLVGMPALLPSPVSTIKKVSECIDCLTSPADLEVRGCFWHVQ